MKFDIKDVKSWANRHDVKVGDEGYFADNIEELKTEDNRTNMIAEIFDDHAFCFRTPSNRYSFFLPLESVKEDKPKEKKYRPFKNLYEFYKFLSYDNSTEEEFTQNMLLGEVFTYREKKAPRYAHTVVINRIDFDLADDPCASDIEGRNLGLWFDYAEIMNDDGEWQPFGVEVKENDSD